MDLVLLGTGCPQCDPLRMGPSNLVRHEGRAFLVDCGSGVTQRLVEAGTPGAAIDARATSGSATTLKSAVSERAMRVQRGSPR